MYMNAFVIEKFLMDDEEGIETEKGGFSIEETIETYSALPPERPGWTYKDAA